MAARKTKARPQQPEPASRGLTAAEVMASPAADELGNLERAIADADGRVLSCYREPLGGSWVLLAALPVERVAPTPFQRDLSDAHVKRLEDGSLVTLGCAYQEKKSFAGGAYAAALKQSDAFLDQPIGQALERRRARAARLLAIDERVAEIMAALKERGFDSPYLRNFVVSRIRPFRPRGQPAPDADALLDRMEEKAATFDAGNVKRDQIANAATASD